MISLREFANRQEHEALAWLNPRRMVTVGDDFDQTIDIDTYLLMASWYGLSLHRHYDKIPYSVDELIESDVIENSEFFRPVEVLLYQLMDIVDDPIESDHCKQIIYEWQIKLNNFLTALGQGGEVSATAFDVETLMSEPEILDLKQRLRNMEITIDEAELEFKQIILHSEKIQVTVFVMLARVGGVSVNQAFQTVITRGSVFDLNNQILPNPIEPSFAEGIVNPADALGENRGAGKSLLSNGKALENSEWFHRKLHISTSVKTDVGYLDDCGTDRLVPVKIQSSDHLRSMEGKYVMYDDKLVVLNRKVMKSFKKGDTVMMRSVAFCERFPASEPCGVCYGKMKASIPYNVIMMRSANIGMFSSTAIAERIGQSLLSTKHFLRHTSAIPFVVNPADDKLISTDGDFIYLRPALACKGTRLIMDAALSSELADLRNLDSLDDTNEDQLQTFTNVTMEFVVPDPMVDGETITERTVSTSVSSRSARMSRDLIEFVINKGWEREKKRMYIDLSDFPTDLPLFFLPYVHEDLDQYRIQIESFLSFSNRNDAWLKREVNEEILGETLAELWVLVNRKFTGINQIHSEVILSALLGTNPSEGLYRLPAGRESRYFVPFSQCIENRGMGGLYIYQKQNSVLERASTYGVKERQGGLMEAYLSMSTV